MRICSYAFLIFTEGPMNDWKIEQCNGRCFGLLQVLSKSIETPFFHQKKHVLSHGHSLKFTKHQTFLTLGPSQLLERKRLKARQRRPRCRTDSQTFTQPFLLSSRAAVSGGPTQASRGLARCRPTTAAAGTTPAGRGRCWLGGPTPAENPYDNRVLN